MNRRSLDNLSVVLIGLSGLDVEKPLPKSKTYTNN